MTPLLFCHFKRLLFIILCFTGISICLFSTISAGQKNTKSSTTSSLSADCIPLTENDMQQISPEIVLLTEDDMQQVYGAESPKGCQCDNSCQNTSCLCSPVQCLCLGSGPNLCTCPSIILGCTLSSLPIYSCDNNPPPPPTWACGYNGTSGGTTKPCSCGGAGSSCTCTICKNFPSGKPCGGKLVCPCCSGGTCACPSNCAKAPTSCGSGNCCKCWLPSQTDFGCSLTWNANEDWYCCFGRNGQIININCASGHCKKNCTQPKDACQCKQPGGELAINCSLKCDTNGCDCN